MKEDFIKIEGHGYEIYPCPLCSSPAELWERTGSIVKKAVMCTRGETLGPLPNGCPLYMPPEDFYCDRKKEAVALWNDFVTMMRSLRQ